MKHTYHIKLRAALWTMLGIACFAFFPAMAAEPEWWAQQKRDCGLPSNLVYNDWDGTCNSGNSSTGYDNGAAQRAQAAEVAAAAERQRQQEQAERIERERLAEETRQQEVAFIRDRDAAASTLRGSSDTNTFPLRGISGTDNYDLKGSNACPPSQDPSVVDLCFSPAPAAPPLPGPAPDPDEDMIGAMVAVARNQGFSQDELDRVDIALKNLPPENDPPPYDNERVQDIWAAIRSRGERADLAAAAASGQGPDLYSAGWQSGRYDDCAVFALATAAGLPYGLVAARANELISASSWREPEIRNNPLNVYKTGGLNGGETILLAEAFGRAEIVPRSAFVATLREGRPVTVGVQSTATALHQIVLSRTFEHEGNTWFEIIDSAQGNPGQRSYMTAEEFASIEWENGVSIQPELNLTPALLR